MFNKSDNKTKYIIIGCFLAVSLGLNAYFFTKTNSDMFPPSNMPSPEIMTCVDECDESCYQNSTPKDEEACFYSCASRCIVSDSVASCSSFDADSLDMYNLTDTEKNCLCTSLCMAETEGSLVDCASMCTKENNYNNLFGQFKE